MIALSSAASSAGDGSPPSSTAMTVWRNRARRVRVSGLARPAAGRSNGFRCTPGAPRWTYAPPTAAARRAYSSSGSMTQHSVPSYSDRRISSLARYDFPAPEAARVTELWLPSAHRSQATSPGPAVLRPYSTPVSACGVGGVTGQVRDW